MSTYGIYRKSRWLYERRIPWLPTILKGVNYLIHSCSVPYQCEIGDNCTFLYGGLGTVISKKAVVGRHVIIGTNVLIGGRSNKEGHPVIGDNVYIATGAKVLGDVVVASNVIIGANAVVIQDVPSGCSVAGVPARVIKENIDVREYCSLGVL